MKKIYEEINVQLHFFEAADILTLSDDAADDIFGPDDDPDPAIFMP